MTDQFWKYLSLKKNIMLNKQKLDKNEQNRHKLNKLAHWVMIWFKIILASPFFFLLKKNKNPDYRIK